MPGVWTLALSPHEAASKAMWTLPDSEVFLALHSNPGPEHVFVDPASKQLSGIIDFGDAYFGHPVHDLRRFRAPADRAAVFAGYTDGAPVSENFTQFWRAACLLVDLLAVAQNPECRAEALAELETLTGELG